MKNWHPEEEFRTGVIVESNLEYGRRFEVPEVFMETLSRLLTKISTLGLVNTSRKHIFFK